MAKKQYEDDDGRSFADMSQIERPNFFSLGHMPERRERDNERPQKTQAPSAGDEMTKQERRWYVLGTLKASLLIGLAYVVGLGLLILLMVSFW